MKKTIDTSSLFIVLDTKNAPGAVSRPRKMGGCFDCKRWAFVVYHYLHRCLTAGVLSGFAWFCFSIPYIRGLVFMFRHRSKRRLRST